MKQLALDECFERNPKKGTLRKIGGHAYIKEDPPPIRKGHLR
jgi:hypothetical protein